MKTDILKFLLQVDTFWAGLEQTCNCPGPNRSLGGSDSGQMFRVTALLLERARTQIQKHFIRWWNHAGPPVSRLEREAEEMLEAGHFRHSGSAGQTLWRAEVRHPAGRVDWGVTVGWADSRELQPPPPNTHPYQASLSLRTVLIMHFPPTQTHWHTGFKIRVALIIILGWYRNNPHMRSRVTPRGQ